ncbi:Ig domain-containing protein [Roseateles sp. BYS87W]|uniref:Ig domain-containing protein n=1 Tax=Pelomonas baiyunensis TaxID=3299026 RepID=A0ABW7H232_9BURK
MRGCVIGAVALAAGMLASCGGGGSTAESCNSVGIVPITTTWVVSGAQYNPPPYTVQVVVGRVGTPLVARPIHTGVLPQCVGKGVYALGSAAHPLPAGLTLNTATGEISGTPTAAGDTNGGDAFTGAVRLSFPGVTSLPVLARLVVEK